MEQLSVVTCRYVECQWLTCHLRWSYLLRDAQSLAHLPQYSGFILTDPLPGSTWRTISISCCIRYVYTDIQHGICIFNYLLPGSFGVQQVNCAAAGG